MPTITASIVMTNDNNAMEIFCFMTVRLPVILFAQKPQIPDIPKWRFTPIAIIPEIVHEKCGCSVDATSHAGFEILLYFFLKFLVVFDCGFKFRHIESDRFPGGQLVAGLAT